MYTTRELGRSTPHFYCITCRRSCKSETMNSVRSNKSNTEFLFILRLFSSYSNVSLIFFMKAHFNIILLNVLKLKMKIQVFCYAAPRSL